VVLRRANTWPLGSTDPNFANVSLLLHGEGTNGSTVFTDSSSNAITVTKGGDPAQTTTISTAQQKYGTASIFNTGGANIGSHFITASSSVFTFGTGDFTVEMFFYLSNLSANVGFVFQSPAADVNQSMGLALWTGNIRYCNQNGTILIDGGSNPASNTWHHIAVARSGTATKLFVNGTQVGSTFTDTRNYASTQFCFGGETSWFSSVGAYYDEIRITKGVARYTANFTPPIAAFPDA
jgi:hypothetical protein